MSLAVSYVDFHLVFVLPALAVVAAASYRRRLLTDARAVGLGVMVALALLYTAPWDNYLIIQNVWSYGEGTVAARLWVAPVEEYLFILLQTVAAGLWVYHVAPDRAPTYEISRLGRVGGALAGATVSAVGLLMLSGPTYYMGAILAWAGPVLALQWAFGWPYLLRVRRAFGLAVAVPTLYFAASDRVAIELGIWTLSKTHTTGLTVAGLPVEEGAFFFVTNLFLAQGLLLYQWLYERWWQG